MPARDYLTPFAIVNRAICEGLDEREVMNLMTRFVTETLNLSGCFIKIRTPDEEDFSMKKESLDFDQSSSKIKFSQGSRLELISSYGLSESFLYSKPINSA